MEIDEKDAMNAHCKEFSYNQLVAMMLELKSQHTQLKDQTAEAWEHFSHLARSIIPNKMDAEQIQNITVILPDGTKKRLQLLDKISVKTPPENRLELWEWLRDHDAAEIITETVNASTLSSFVGQQMKLGEPYPNDICDVSSYTTASLVKA